MSHGLFFVWFVCDAWNLKPKFRDEKNYGEIVAYFCGMCAFCLIVFLKSFLSCQALAQALQQNSTLTYLNLEDNNIGPDGAKAWCSVRMGPDGVMTGRGIKAPPYESSSIESQRCWIFLVTTDWRSESQVWNGIPIIWYHMDVVEAETVCVCGWLSQILQEVWGGAIDWSKMTSDRGTGQILPKIT